MPAPSVPADVGSLPEVDRATLAEELGYRSIGADLPSNVTLTDVISSLPKSVSQCLAIDGRLCTPMKLILSGLAPSGGTAIADIRLLPVILERCASVDLGCCCNGLGTP